jgi:hypothetical protein
MAFFEALGIGKEWLYGWMDYNWYSIKHKTIR